MTALAGGSLRVRILTVVLAGAILPLGVAGAWLSRSAVRSAESNLQLQLDSSLAAIASRIDARWSYRRGEFLMMADNAVTMRSLTNAASVSSVSLFVVEELEGGYFDKLRATPISRTSILLGRLYAEFVKTVFVALVMIVIALLFGVHIEAGVGGFVLILVMTALWGIVFSGFLQLVALKARNAAATQGASMVFFPLLFLTPSFVPRPLLTRPMEIAASLNPVTYIMEGLRSLILEGYDAAAIGKAFAVIVVAGALMMALSVRAASSYD